MPAICWSRHLSVLIHKGTLYFLQFCLVLLVIKKPEGFRWKNFCFNLIGQFVFPSVLHKLKEIHTRSGSIGWCCFLVLFREHYNHCFISVSKVSEFSGGFPFLKRLNNFRIIRVWTSLNKILSFREILKNISIKLIKPPICILVIV